MAELDINTSVFQNRLDKLKEAQSEVQRLQIIKQLFRLIQQNTDTISKSMQDGMAVNNFDEVKAMMLNQGKSNINAILKSLQSMKISQEEQSRVSQALMDQVMRDMQSQFNTITIKSPRDIVSVENLDEILMPEDVRVNNLGELEDHFNRLADVVRETFNVDIPAPQVTVEPTPINIPDTAFPEINFDIMENRLKTISQSLTKIKNNGKTNPLAVRLSDGREWLNQIVAELGKVQTSLAGFSDRVKLVDKGGKILDLSGVSIPSGIGDGTTSLTTGGTAQQLSATSIKCKRVFISPVDTNTSVIYIGGSTVDNSPARGKQLYQGEDFDVEIDDVSKIYFISATTGDTVTYMYTS